MIVGVDLSLTATGIAIYRGTPPDGQLELRTIDGTKTRGFERIQAVAGAVWKAVEDPMALTVFEGYAFGAKGDAVTGLAELRGVCQYAMWCWAALTMTVPPANLKQYATGKGNASKEEVLLAVERRYGHLATIGNNNEADALVLVAMALHRYGSPLAQVPKSHEKALSGSARSSLSWPAYHVDGRAPRPYTSEPGGER
jgi:crossover junction endodeoxyribonuclease RuvC